MDTPPRCTRHGSTIPDCDDCQARAEHEREQARRRLEAGAL